MRVVTSLTRSTLPSKVVIKDTYLIDSFKDMSPIIDYDTFTTKKVYVYQDDSYSFNLSFHGIPWPNVTLYFNNQILLSYSDPIGSSLSLTLNNLSILDEGIYFARVMNR
jgi:hypothetical protein